MKHWDNSCHRLGQAGCLVSPPPVCLLVGWFESLFLCKTTKTTEWITQEVWRDAAVLFTFWNIVGLDVFHLFWGDFSEINSWILIKQNQSCLGVWIWIWISLGDCWAFSGGIHALLLLSQYIHAVVLHLFSFYFPYLLWKHIYSDQFSAGASVTAGGRKDDGDDDRLLF